MSLRNECLRNNPSLTLPGDDPPALHSAGAGDTGVPQLGLESVRSKLFARMGRWACALATLAFCVALLPGESLAAGKKLLRSTEADRSDWHLCEAATLRIEKSKGTPRALLHSISLAESGRFDAVSKKTRAWPWSINAQGRSYYFSSKREAISKAEELLNAGVRSFDVGCMQINLRYHPEAFASLEEAFDPLTNVTYGAEFLTQLRNSKGSWPAAIGQYHSGTTFLHKRYFARVIRIWEQERPHFVQLARYEERQQKLQLAGLRITHGNELSFNVPPPPPPAPMVLTDGAIRVATAAATASVGLRVSLADLDFSTGNADEPRPTPRVLAPVQIPDMPMQTAAVSTLVADAGI